MTSPQRRRVAVLGSGVAGLTAAHVLTRSVDRPAHVTLFEADMRLGGHADTHDVDGLAIDTGFIVHNRRTYPTLLRLFAELGVATQESEMSMSISDRADGTELEWAGALGVRGVFPTPRSLVRPAYLRMLTEIPRFHRRARRLLDGPVAGDDLMTLREFLADGGFSAYFTRHFMEPVVAAVWSCEPGRALDYPARYLVEFLAHHGMLQVFGSPTWRTVTGGSREYVDRLAAGLSEVRLGTKVTSVVELDDRVEITDGNGEVTSYDAVVVATHPDQALGLLAEPTLAQREVLSAIGYSSNTARLHTDTSLLPTARRAWASWNFQRPARGDQLVVTYDLTRLQRLPTDTHYLVTLGGEDLVDPATVIDTMEYAHPLYTPDSVAAQRRVPEIHTDRVAFAGAWCGWGFHEDGARSGLAAAERLGARWGSDVAAGPRTDGRLRGPHATVADHPQPVATNLHRRPAAEEIFEVTIRHTRRTPLKHAFSYRSHAWLVDLDRLPRHGPLARFEARDHLGDPAATLRENVDAFLATQGIDLRGGRVRMLANPRVLGYCFNPISVYWCDDETGAQECVVVEVHNTYGDRHAYVVRPDVHGKATVDKALYVSPFNDVSGRYDLAVPTPTDRLAVTVSLGDFVASMTGRRLPPGRRSMLRASVRTPAAPLLATARIRWQGIHLWARGLRVQPRPEHPSQEGVQ